MRSLDRRTVLKAALGAGVAQLAFAAPPQRFSFACLSDAHLSQLKGRRFVRNQERGLMRAVAEINLLQPRPDFVVFGGDLAQMGKREELEHGAELLSALRCPTHYVMGEHDYYLDLGEAWSKLFGPQHYSFDHKGVHFVVLNSVLTPDAWLARHWPSPAHRMLQLSIPDDPDNPPFLVGQAQRAWLFEDLGRVPRSQPVVVLSHAPLQKLYRGWNFWTDDAEDVQALFRPFNQVNVLHGHVHQLQYAQVGNISFNSMMATSWPRPYPTAYAQAKPPPLHTIPMNRVDPFFERDGTGWQSVEVNAGRLSLQYHLAENRPRRVVFNPQTGAPEDQSFHDSATRASAQEPY